MVSFSGMVAEFALAVDRSTDVPLGQQIQEAFRTAIRAGRLRSRERLPSTRQLADQLGVSRGLVVSAYEQLLAEGYVVSVVGSGTRVSDALSGADTVASRAAEGPLAGWVPEMGIDFGYGVPDLQAFPRRDWLWALGDAMNALPTGDLGDGEAEGNAHVRAVLAGYHRRVRAGCAEPADTIVVGGFRQGLTFVLGALAAHGIEQIGLEDPGPRDHDHIARRAGLRVSAVPVDAQGLRVDALRASGARAALVTPAHQCPTGAVLSPSRRHELVQWAHEVDGVILEDDYDAEFRYDRRPVGALAARAPERVVYLGSTSKTLSPGLHLGWMVAPAALHDGLAEARDLVSSLVPVLDQLALVHLIESGAYDRHLRRMRRRYQQRRSALLAALAAAGVPGAPAASMDAGLHVLWHLPPGADEARVLARARERGLTVLGLSQCRVGPGAPGLVLGYGNVPAHRAPSVASVLATAAG